jgi:4-amino-4-deoxy-L-arabinose transferase-like glycosyltransferase
MNNTLVWEDEKEFVDVARRLAGGEGYVSSSFRANPCLPVYLSAVFRMFGDHYVAARIGQAIMGALTCVLIYRLGWRLAGRPVGLLSGLFLAFYPPHIYLAGLFYVDCLLTFLLALSVAAAVRTPETTGGGWFALLTGVGLGVTALTRPIYLATIPCVCLAWIYDRRASIRGRVALCLVLIAGTSAVILPWTLRNYRVYGRFILISSGFYTKLWQGNNILADGGPDDRDLRWDSPDWRSRLIKLDGESRPAIEAKYATLDRDFRERWAELKDKYLASDEVLKPVAFEEIRSNKLRVIGLVLRKMATLFSPFSTTETNSDPVVARLRWVAFLSFYPVLIFALLGATCNARKQELAILYLLIGSVSLAYASLTACTRFRLPLDPFLLIFSSLGLLTFWRWIPTGHNSLSGRTRPSTNQGESLTQRKDSSLADLLQPSADLTLGQGMAATPRTTK